MKFKSYLLTEGRIKKLSEKDALKALNTSFSMSRSEWENSGKSYIYRGTNSLKSDYAIGNGKGQYPRKSRNTTNYTTMFIDNSKMWSSYPKRSESFICSTSKTKASIYNHNSKPYHVFPSNGSKIGVCPSSDIFNSFMFAPGINVPTINEYISRVMELYNEIKNKNEVIFTNDDNWNRFTKDLETIKNGCKDDPSIIDKINEDIMDFESEFTRFSFDGDLMSELEKIYNPKTNGFDLKMAGDSIKYDREVWMSGDCLFMNNDIVGDV
jgi:hypothetical protein